MAIVKVLSYVFFALLWAWFFGCIVTYRLGKHVLVEGMGVKSAEFIMLSLYSIGGIAYILYRPIGQWVLLAVMIFWLAVQFRCHWYYTIFGASDKKLQGYNKCFENTIHLFPQSKTRIVPDLYHIVLHLLILTEIIILFFIIFKGV